MFLLLTALFVSISADTPVNTLPWVGRESFPNSLCQPREISSFKSEFANATYS